MYRNLAVRPWAVPLSTYPSAAAFCAVLFGCDLAPPGIRP